MSMLSFACVTCGGTQYTEKNGVRTCLHCGNRYNVTNINGTLTADLQYAMNERQEADFDKARRRYDAIISKTEGINDDACEQAYWGKFLCEQYVIFYRNDNDESIPSFWNVNDDKCEASPNYISAVRYGAISGNKDNYEKLAKLIEIYKQKYRQVKKEIPQGSDIFICFKDTGTEDRNIGYTLYNKFSGQYNVFFSPESLNSISGNDYEPYIYHALTTAKVLILICSSREALESKWVHNEWWRFVNFSGISDKIIIPIFRTGFDATQLPYEIKNCQAHVENIELVANLQKRLQNIFKKNTEVYYDNVDSKILSSHKAKISSDKNPIGIKSEKNPTQERINLDNIKKRNKISRIIVGASLALLLAGALVYYNFIDKVPTAETEGPIQGNSVGDVCYSADISLFSGETFNLEDTRGKVTVLSFWGAWNEPSLELLEELDKIKGELGDTVSVVAIHSNYESDGAESFIAENYPDSAMLFGYDDEKESYFDLLGGSVTYPLTFVIDEEGIITARYESAVSYEDLSRDVRVALNVPGNMVGDRCYTADIELIGGGMHNLEDTKGKITVINFWGTWCGPCVAELPHFDTIASEYGDTVAVIAIHTDYGNDKAPAFIEEKYPESSIMFGVDKGEEYYKRLGGKGTYPMTVIVDEDGIVVAKYVSSVTYDMLKDAIDAALAD